MEHTHKFTRSKPLATVETCSCGKFRHTENAGEPIKCMEHTPTPYYKGQLEKIVVRPSGSYPCAVFQVQDQNNKTHWLNVNQESVDALVVWFKDNGFNINL